jgi:hypothetical protein
MVCGQLNIPWVVDDDPIPRPDEMERILCDECIEIQRPKIKITSEITVLEIPD